MTSFPKLGSRNEQADPFRAMVRTRHQIDQFLESGWTPSFSSMEQEAFQPTCDAQETDSHYTLSFDLPGLKKDDIKIEVQDGVLRVSGERKDERGSAKRTESYYGAIERAVTLPSNVKTEGVEAQFENGVLYVAIPKAEISKPKQVVISEGKPSKLLGKKEGKAA